MNLANIINTTKHGITFQVGDDLVTIPPSVYTVNAKRQEISIGADEDVLFTEIIFEGDPETESLLKALKERNPRCIIVGSSIAAQAYPGLVCMMTPMPGYERVPDSEKRMNPLKFSVYPQQPSVAVGYEHLDAASAFQAMEKALQKGESSEEQA